ncbi:unnamed protein product [Tuber melanosporum]|uniref:(Perigord truffle) hypothetical protein n=1 Tax=Tuber melanosporum (strain Mel28) TaxID=656061 RepID=D5G613_TUBMM|nr:uncharacterized protein GSTUM_00001721001 [Tuber melanosporum]CAZ79956.1 unnamed protein product [Tuber melanosporum]
MSATLQYQPLQDLRRYVSLLDMHPVDPETETDISLQAMVPGQLYGRWDKSETFRLPRSLWSPLSKAVGGACRSVASSKEVDPKDSISHSKETVPDPTRVPIPISDVSGTGVPRSILPHPGLRGIREETIISPGSVAEAVSSAYQYQARLVSADSFPLLKKTASIRSALGNGPELGSRRGAQYGSASDHFMSPKLPIGSPLTPPKGQQVGLIQQYIPTRQYTSRTWNSLAPTKQHDRIDLDPLYHFTISKCFECFQASPSKLRDNFTAGNSSTATSSPGLLANMPWVFTMFGRASAFHTSSPLKTETSAPIGGPGIEALIHPRHLAYFHQFLTKSVLKGIEGLPEAKGTACEIVKDGVALEEDNDGEHKIADLEPNVELDMHNRPISAHCRRGSTVATRMMEESDTAELIEVLASTFHENDNRVTELGQDTEECEVAETAPSGHRRTNSLRYAVRQRASLFKPTSVKSDFTFVTEVTASPPVKRKQDDNTEKASRKRTRDNSVEYSIASPRNSIASRLSILIDNAEQRQAKLNSPGRELILSPINTQCVQVTEHLITEPFLSNSIPDSPVTPTSFTESTARSSTHSVSSAGTSLTVPYSHASPSASSALLTKKAWEEEQLRGRQSARGQNESRFPCAPGSGLGRSRSTGGIDSERPTEYSVELTRRRSLSTNSMLEKYAPMFQQPTVTSAPESQNLEIGETPSSSGSSSFVEPTELEDSLISSPPTQPQATLLVPEIKPEDTKKDAAQKKGPRRISYLGQLKSHKSFTAKVTEPSTTVVVSETEDGANKKKKFQKLKNRVKGITRKVSGVMKGEKY